MKVVIPCPGIGHVPRGFESSALDLARALQNDLDVTVYGGQQLQDSDVDVTVLPTLKRTGKASKLLVPAAQRYRVEQLLFSGSLVPTLLKNRFDIVHLSDSLVALALTRLRKRLGLDYRLVFSNGGNRDPSLLKNFDLCQVLTPIQKQTALEQGVAEERLEMIPYAIHTHTFRASATSRADARREFGIPENMKVVLAVAPLDHHKRLDFLVRELASLGRSDVFFLAAGLRTADTPQLEVLAQSALSGRYVFKTVPRSEIKKLYHAADVFALPTLREGFGLVVLEAMAAGIPLVIHDWPLFRWMVPNDACRVDFSEVGAAAARLRALFGGEISATDVARENSNNVNSRFDWHALKPAYLKMYERARTLSPIS